MTPQTLDAAARLHEENALLRRVAQAAGRVFSTLDARAIVDLLAAEARRLWGGSVALYGKGVKPDEFIAQAFARTSPHLSADSTRLAMPVPGTSGRNEWVLDIRSARGVFGKNDVFAIDILGRYAAIAIQNVSLFSELQSQRASVIRLNALKDDLIAILAHDFKGPLTTISGFTELLEQKALQGDDAQDALRTIRQSAMRLAALADDTLAISRVEQGDLDLAADPVDIALIAEQSAQVVGAQREVRVSANTPDVVVRGDPSRLRQVLDNIIGNAVKYSPGGEPVEVSVIQTERAVRISVRDCGIGVPAAEMKLIFERFRRASNAKQSRIKGNGLGLYLAKTLVERHGGTIQVQSTVGAGSTFTVVLPRMRDGMGGVLRVAVLTADEHLAPYLAYELRTHGLAVRQDKTLTALLERLALEPADVVLVDVESIEAQPDPLFKASSAPAGPVGLVRIGGAPEVNEARQWDAHLPKPFLARDLHEAVAIADRARTKRTKGKRTQR